MRLVNHRTIIVDTNKDEFMTDPAKDKTELEIFFQIED